MKVLTGICSLVALVLFPFLASANPTNPTAISLNITGTATAAQPGDIGSYGQCNVADWVQACPSQNCQCLQIDVSSISGTGLGKGHHLSASNFFVTLDKNFTPSTAPSTDGQCSLFFAVVTVTGKHGSGTVNAYGTGCQQYPNNNLTKILGGWGISDNPTPINLTGGWGTLTGSSSSKNTVKFQLTGWLE